MKFALGDDPRPASPSFSDDTWSTIRVPAYWEDEGYPGYDGFAWHRIRFRVQRTTADRGINLLLGKIDDADEVYLNGEFLGRTGQMLRPDEKGSYGENYKKLRAYTIPQGRLYADGENLLAVKVHDDYRYGGIYKGPIGFVTREHYLTWTKRQDKRPKGWDAFDGIFR